MDITYLYSQKAAYPGTRFKVLADKTHRESFFEHVRMMSVNGESAKVEEFVRKWWDKIDYDDKRRIMKICNENKPSTISSGSEAPRSKNPFLVKI